MKEQGAELRRAKGCRRDGRRRIRPSKEVSQAVRRRSPVGMPQTRREAAFGSVVPPFWGARPGRLSTTRERARLTSLAAGAKAAAHEGAPQTTRKDEQIGAGERRVVPTEHDVEAAADATTEGREQAEAAGAEGRQCEARPSRVQRVADFAAWAEKVTEGVRAPHSGEPKRKRRSGVERGSTGEVDGDCHRRCARARNDGAARGGSDGGRRDGRRRTRCSAGGREGDDLEAERTAGLECSARDTNRRRRAPYRAGRARFRRDVDD